VKGDCRRSLDCTKSIRGKGHVLMPVNETLMFIDHIVVAAVSGCRVTDYCFANIWVTLILSIKV
jgi:hypothetical protein